MKQYQFVYEGVESLALKLDEISSQNPNPASVLFQVFCDCWPENEVGDIRSCAKEHFPGCVFAGASSWGNIVDGNLNPDTIEVVCMVFEDPSTRVESFSMELRSGEAPIAACRLVDIVADRPWVKAVEVLMMIGGETTIGFCKEMSNLPESVQVFGGESHFARAADAPKFVIGDNGELIRYGVVFILYGGENFHIMTSHVNGWKPLGYEMRATKYVDNILMELDGKPAFDLHYKYLNIENDENFFGNVLEFPFLFDADGTTVLRMPVAGSPARRQNVAA